MCSHAIWLPRSFPPRVNTSPTTLLKFELFPLQIPVSMSYIGLPPKSLPAHTHMFSTPNAFFNRYGTLRILRRHHQHSPRNIPSLTQTGSVSDLPVIPASLSGHISTVAASSGGRIPPTALFTVTSSPAAGKITIHLTIPIEPTRIWIFTTPPVDVACSACSKAGCRSVRPHQEKGV